jgi:hypothetical protein
MNRLPPHPNVADLGEGPWWIAHEHPERPADPHCVWSWNCDPCMMHLIAAATVTPHGASKQYANGQQGVESDLAATLQEARVWRFQHGYRPF